MGDDQLSARKHHAEEFLSLVFTDSLASMKQEASVVVAKRHEGRLWNELCMYNRVAFSPDH